MVTEQLGVHAPPSPNTAVAVEGRPETEKETGFAVPETRVVMSVFVTVEPLVADLLPPFVREKSKGARTFRVSGEADLLPSGVLPVTMIE